jgi:hypothetical protein
MARDAPITHTPDTNKEVPLLTDKQMALFYDPPKEPSVGSFTDSQENVLHMVTNETFDSKDTDDPPIVVKIESAEDSPKAVTIENFA